MFNVRDKVRVIFQGVRLEQSLSPATTTSTARTDPRSRASGRLCLTLAFKGKVDL